MPSVQHRQGHAYKTQTTDLIVSYRYFDSVKIAFLALFLTYRTKTNLY